MSKSCTTSRMSESCHTRHTYQQAKWKTITHEGSHGTHVTESSKSKDTQLPTQRFESHWKDLTCKNSQTMSSRKNQLYKTTFQKTFDSVYMLWVGYN